MGMGMVGYIVFGPKKLGASPDDPKSQVDHLRRLVMDVRKDLSGIAQGEIFAGDENLKIPGKWLEEFESSGYGEIPEVVPAIFRPSDSEVTDDDLMKEIERLGGLWESAKYASDSMMRFMEEDRQVGDSHRLVVSAGDATWGDEPQGAGYQALSELVGHPFAEHLGLD